MTSREAVDERLDVGTDYGEEPSFCTAPDHLPKCFSRPFVVPIFDPQGSNQSLNYDLDIPRQPPRTKAKRPQLATDAHAKTRDDTSWSHVEDMGGIGRHGKSQWRAEYGSGFNRSVRRSRLSITPSELPSILSASRLQEQELQRISRHDRPVLYTDQAAQISAPSLENSSEYTPRNIEESMVAKVDEEARRVDEPPNGGFRAWMHALAGFLVIMNCQGMNLSFGVFQAYYQVVLLPDSSPSRLAWIGSFQCFAIYFMGLITNSAMRKGVNFRYFTVGGSVLLFVGLILTSFCKKFWQIFLAQGILTGIAMGSVFSAGVTVLMSYWSSRLGIASASMAAGAPVGGIVYPVLAKVLSGHVSFGWIVRVFAIVNATTMLSANLIIRDRLTKPKVPPSPPTMGKPSLDSRSCKSVLETSSKPQLGATDVAGLKTRETANIGNRSEKLSSEAPYLLMLIGMFFAFWGLFNGYYFIVSFAESVLGLGNSASINLLIAMNASNLVGRMPPGLISDACLGPLNTVIPATFISGAFAMLMTGVSTEKGVFLVACFYGFATATLQSLYIGTIYSFVGFDRDKAAARMGMVMSAIGMATLTGAPIGGQLIVSDGGHYGSAQVFAGATLTIGGCFFLAARVMKSGWAAKKL